MPVEIKKSKSNNGSKGMQVAMGAATGGWAGAGKALIGANNKALGAGLSAYDSMSAKSNVPEPDTITMPEIGSSMQAPPVGVSSPDALMKPEIGSSYKMDTAIGRKLHLSSQDPAASLNQGLAALKDPSVPQELRDMYAKPMLQAKHYGRLV